MLLVGSLVASPSVAQDDDPPAFGEEVDVRVINLEVVVTDRDGNRLSGLAPEDFRLRVDGRETPIDYFSEIAASRVVATGPDATAPSPVVPEPAEQEVVPRSIVVFVDNLFGTEAQRNVALSGLRAAVGALHPADRMAIVSFDGRDLHLLADWTTSPAALVAALDAAAAEPAYGLQRKAELSQYDLLRRRLGAGSIQESERMFLESYLQRLTRQVESVVRAATTTVRTLADTSGRKTMILLSGGWPREPLFYARSADPGVSELDLRAHDRRVGRALADLTDTANLVGYTLYPVDVPQRESSSIDAGTASIGPDLSADGAPLGIAAGGREWTREASLLEIAEETGGEAYLNATAVTALESTLADTATYYWLGFVPEREHDDQEHEIRIDVDRPGVKVRVRQGFKDLSRESEVTMLVESQLLFSNTLGHGLAVQLHEPDVTRRKLALPISLLVPLDEVVMLPSRKGYEANLELRVAVIDEEGDRSEMPVIPISFAGEEPPAPGAHVIYDTTLRLRNQKQRLVLALYDTAGEGLLSTTFEMEELAR